MLGGHANEEEVVTADAIAASDSGRLDVILRDLEFVENRLGARPAGTEKSVLNKIKTALESEQLRFRRRIESGRVAGGVRARVSIVKTGRRRPHDGSGELR